MKGFRKLGDPLFSQGLTARLGLGTRMTAGGVTLYTISGTVYDADGTTPVSGATVTLGALSAVSGADGTYTISSVPAGTSGSMTCTKTGYSWTAIAVAEMTGNLTAQNYTNAWWAAAGCGAICVAAWQPIGAASFAASKTDIATGTYTAADGANPPSWTAVKGWYSPDGAIVYTLTSTLAAVAGMSMIAGFKNVDTGVGYQAKIGIENSLMLSPNLVGTLRIGYGGSVSSFGGAKANTVLAIAAGKPYIDGVLQTAISPSAFSGNIFPFGQTGRLGIFDVVAVAAYSSEISQAQVTALTNAINALP